MAYLNGKKIMQVVQTEAVAVDIEANPQGEATDDLSKIKIDDTIYLVDPSGVTPDAAMSDSSVNAVQNKVITAALEEKANVDGYYETFGYAKESGVASNLKNRSNAYVGAKYTYRTSGGTADIGNGTAEIKKLKGNSIVFNQLIQNGNFASTSNWNNGKPLGLTFSVANNEATVEVIDETVSDKYISTNVSMIIGHKYLFIGNAKTNVISTNVFCLFYGGASNHKYIQSTVSGVYDTYTYIFECVSNTYNYVRLQNDNANGDETFYKNVMLIDLTQMFGAGNEPTTVDEFKALFPLDYYAYNSGEIINFNGTGIKTIGFNQWDEEWGNYVWNENNNGIRETNNLSLGCKEHIKVLSNTTYYISSGKSGNFYVLFYDANKNYISYSFGARNRTFTTPSNCYYITFYSYNSYGTTYNNDICINLSWSGWRNGEYEAYNENTLTFDLSSIKDTNNDTLFPNGLCSAESVYDEITSTKAIKRIGRVDLGSLNWSYNSTQNFFYTNDLTNAKGGTSTSGNCLCPIYTLNTVDSWANMNNMSYAFASTNQLRIKNTSYSNENDFKTAMSGVILEYELAEPVEVDIDWSNNLAYQVDDFGTEQALPENDDEPTTAPINYDVLYPFNAIDTLRNLPKNYISKDSFDNFASSLITAMASIGYTMTITPTYNDNTNEYTFAITLAQTQQGE